MPEITVADLARRVLATAGVHVAYGRPTAGIPVVAVTDTDVALTLCAAHRAVHGTSAAAMLDDALVRIPGGEPGVAESRVVTDVDSLLALAPEIVRVPSTSGLDVRFDLDLDEPAPDVYPAGLADRWSEPAGDVVDRLSNAPRVVVLAGPGVVSNRAVAALHAFATAGRLGVVNTWGAKGVFHWRSQHHWATVGLQEDDFALAGLDRADLVVSAGIDEREAPSRLWGGYPHVVVAPRDLGRIAELWPGPSEFLEMPPLRTRLAAVTQAGWSSTSSPIAPSRVTMHYALRLADGGLVAADAGVGGYWVARTFATTELGAVCVPPATTPGWAVACVLSARLARPMRPALAVLSGDVDDHSRSVLETAARLGIEIGVEVWNPGGDLMDPDTHLSRLGSLVDSRIGGVVTLSTDERQIAEMVAAAGYVRAWRD